MQFIFEREYSLFDINIFWIVGYMLGVDISLWYVLLFYLFAMLSKVVLEAIFYT